MTRRARFSGVPLHVEEDHHHVLAHILGAIGAKRLPLENNVLLHLDSHPDLLLPRNLTVETAESKRDLLSAVSIENWILPMAALGLVNRIVWIHPSWSFQIPDGSYTFHIGTHRESGKLRITSTEDYFVSEGIVCPRDEIAHEREVALLVIQMDDQNLAKTINDFIDHAIGQEDSLILDIDLDFFSTRNPFLDMFPRADLYSKLKNLYAFDAIPKGLEDNPRVNFALESCRKRVKLLDELEDIFLYLQEHGDLDEYKGSGVEYVSQVREIKDAIETHYEGDVDWILVHNAGCTCDNTDLPHHVSDQEEIEHLITEVRRLLLMVTNLRHPKVITISRSSLDEFCPLEQVEDIQTRTINLLTELYNDVTVHYDYQDNRD